MLDKRVVFCYNPHPKANECVAQLVEHLTFNQVALGSNPSTLTNKIKDLQNGVGPFFVAWKAA